MLTILSLNHRHTPLAERARYALDQAEQNRFYRLIRRTCRGQVVYLSTCNRVEIVSWIPSLSQSEALGLVRRLGHWFFPGLAPGYLDQAEALFGAEAAAHLLRVAGGLESQIIGDIQVLGQVRGAYLGATRAKTVGPELHRLFQTALHTGRQVHWEGGIRSTTVGQAAADELFRRVGPGKIAVVGAGHTGTAAAERLAKAGAQVLVLNRSFERASKLAQRLNAEAGEFGARHALLAGMDGAIVATSATGPVLHSNELAVFRSNRSNHLEIMDLSVPLGCDPAIGQLEGVRLTTLDNLVAPGTASAAADAIITEEVARYQQWLARRSTEWAKVA